MSTPQFINEFRLKYIATFSILFLLSVVTQIVIQIALHQEQTYHTQSTILDNQRARELYYADVTKSIAVDPTHRLEYLQELNQNNSLARWQDTEKALEATPFDDPQIEKDIQAAKPHYRLLQWAYLSIVQTDSGKKPADISAQLKAIIEQDNAYVFVMYDAYKRLDADATKQVIDVIFIELTLFFLAVLVLNLENFFAMRPALKQLKADLAHEQQKKTLVSIQEK